LIHCLYSHAARGIEIDSRLAAVAATYDQRRPLFQPDRELPQEPKIFNFYMLDTHLTLPPFPVSEARAITLAIATVGVWLALANQRTIPYSFAIATHQRCNTSVDAPVR
jgi:hypothetical protein